MQFDFCCKGLHIREMVSELSDFWRGAFAQAGVAVFRVNYGRAAVDIVFTAP